jgi:hypothetical protein
VETRRAGRANLKPFVAGDPWINRRGRPKNFDAIRELAQAIAHEKTAGDNGKAVTIVESILRSWAKSKDLQAQKAFMEYAFGKVPDKIEGVQLPKQTLILHYGNDRPGFRPDSGPSALRLKQQSATGDGNPEPPRR